MKRALFLTAVLSLFGCSSAPAAQQPAAAGDAAARVGQRVITNKELDDRWKALDPAGHAEAQQKSYDGKRAALDAIVAEALIAEAAKKKSMTPEAFEQAELKARIQPVGEADVVTFYQSNINQMQGRPLAAVVVRATWAAPRPGGADGGSGGIAVRRRIEATSSADGTFLLCDLPRERAVEVSTIVGEVEAPAEPVTIGASETGAIRELTHVDVRP